jgi:hypothetical protein
MYIGILLGAHCILHISRIRVNGEPSYLVVCLRGRPECETGTSDTVGVCTFVEIPLRAPFVTRSPEWSIDMEYVFFT